jgi:hypothetical protein
LIGGILALLAFSLTGWLGTFGLGEQDLVAALNGGIVWPVALCLLVTKLMATAACYGAGGCGGIFAPLLFFGGMAAHGRIPGAHESGPDSSCPDWNDGLSGRRGTRTVDFHLDRDGNEPADLRPSGIDDGSRCVGAYESLVLRREFL